MTNRTALFTQIKYTPHSEAQWSFHNSESRFRVACCGRRFGKTTMAAREMLIDVINLENAGCRYWIVGPNYRLGEKEFRVLHKDLRTLGILSKCKVSYSVTTGNMSVTLPWGTVVEVVSADKPDSLQGEGLSGVIMSEAATHNVQTWEQYIRPALSDKKGWAIFPTTPKGFNYLYNLANRGHDPEFPEWASWTFPSWENPIVYPGGRDDPEILAIEQEVSKQFFDQEIAAQFTTFVGKIYTEFRPDIHVKDIPYNPSWRNYWALDFGYSNPTVCYDIMVDPWDNVYVWREYVKRYLDAYTHGKFLKSERKNPPGWHCDAIFGDPRAAGDIATFQLQAGYVTANPVSWEEGVEAVKRHLKLRPDGRPKLYISHRCPELIRQMQILRAKDVKPGERNPKEGQHDYDDHGPDALRYFFNEWFVLGAGTPLFEQNENSDTFFQYEKEGFVMDGASF